MIDLPFPENVSPSAPPGSVGIDLKELGGSAAEMFEILPRD